MNDLPFSKDILRHAAHATGAGRLEAPSATATVSSPVCGDRIILDLHLDGGTITGLAHDARACVLCQASASILGAVLPGRTAREVAALKTDITAMLKSDGPPPGPPWQDFGVFAPVRGHKSRHNCVLLPITAVEQALDVEHQEIVDST